MRSALSFFPWDIIEYLGDVSLHVTGMKGDLQLKKYARMRRNFCLFCAILLSVALIGLPLSANAESVVLTYDICHKHVAGCMVTMYKTMSADGSEWLRTVSTDTCACGGFHDYYEYDASCSCGRTWHATGHACVNSIYGTNHGTCTNYSYIDCSTQHSHPYTDYGCGKTEDTIVATIMVHSSSISPAQNVILRATSSGELKDVSLSWQGENTSDELTVKKNGTYLLYASYEEGGVEYVTEIKVPVSNIDTIAPVISEITMSEENFTSENVILQVSVKDAAGLPDAYISWNGNGYGNDNQFEVEENGIYHVTVKDIAGNAATKEISVSNIDKNAPVIDAFIASPQPWYEDCCVITVEAAEADGESGLGEEPYSWDEGLTWTDENFYEATESGTIVVQVRDKAGNIATDSIEIIKEELPEEPASEYEEEISEEITTEVIEEASVETSVENMTTDMTPAIPETVPEHIHEENRESSLDRAPIQMESNNAEQVEEAPVSEAPQINEAEAISESGLASAENRETLQEEQINNNFVEEDNTSAPYEETETVVVEEPVIAEGYGGEPLEEIHKEASEGIVVPILTVIIGAITLVLLPIVLYMLLCRCRVYELDEKRQERFLGKAGIHRRKKGYKIMMKEALVKKAESRLLVIRLPKWFAVKEEFKPITISAGKTVMETYIESKIEIHIQE